MAQEDVFKKLVSHCKEYGFVFPSSEIYDGLGAVYDYGQYGVELKNNIKKYWWDSMTLLHENVVGIDSAIFMHPTIWKASGHVDAFNDPLIDNKDSKKRYRADVLIEDHLAKIEEKINKEVAKAAKKFGDAFDEAQFRATNGRVLEYQAKWNEIHERYSKDMNDSNFEDLRQLILDCLRYWTTAYHVDRCPPVQFDVLYGDGFYFRRRHESISATGNSTGYFRQLPERTEDRPHENTFRYRPDRKGFP